MFPVYSGNKICHVRTVQSGTLQHVEFAWNLRKYELRCFFLLLSVHQRIIKGSINCQADVAQLEEQLIRNQQVAGSSPIVGSMKTIRIFEFYCKPLRLAGFKNPFLLYGKL